MTDVCTGESEVPAVLLLPFPLIQYEEKLGWEIQTIDEGEELPILNHHAVTGIVSRSCSI